MRPDLLRLYLVIGPEQCTSRPISETVRQAIRGGVTMVQLRAKTLTDREFVTMARTLQVVCSEADVPLLVNDRADIALASGAAGVHLGVDDVSPEDVRAFVGPEFILGYSPDALSEIEDAHLRGADYLGVGPVYGSATKLDAGQALGLAEFRRRVDASSVPVVGIGGIDASNARAVIDQGAVGVAVVSAIAGADDPRSAAQRIVQLIGG